MAVGDFDRWIEPGFPAGELSSGCLPARVAWRSLPSYPQSFPRLRVALSSRSFGCSQRTKRSPVNEKQAPLIGAMLRICAFSWIWAVCTSGTSPSSLLLNAASVHRLIPRIVPRETRPDCPVGVGTVVDNFVMKSGGDRQALETPDHGFLVCLARSFGEVNG